MQIELAKYDKDKHDRFRVLCAPADQATNLTIPITELFGLQSIYLVKKSTDYRGQVLICSTSKPIISGFQNDCMLGFAELYDCKPVSSFTELDWKRANVKDSQRSKFANFNGWYFRNPERVIEFPFKGNRGFYDIAYTKNIVLKYPTVIEVDKKGIDLAMKQMLTSN